MLCRDFWEVLLKVTVTWHTAKYGDPYLELLLCILPIRVHTHSNEHTHTVNTHSEKKVHSKKVHRWIFFVVVFVDEINTERNYRRGGARVGHPIHNCCLCLFFLAKDCVYLEAERLYDHIKQFRFRVKRLQKRYCARSARSSNTCTKVPARAVACIISCQTAKETMCMQCSS